MDDTGIWTSHLKSGETLVWTGVESEAHLSAIHPQRRLMRLGFGIASGALAIAVAYRFIESGSEYLRNANLNGAIGAPLYLAAAITLAVISVFSFARINERPPAPRRFAITSDRLLKMDHRDKIIGQFPRSEVATIELTDGVGELATETVTAIVTARRHDDAEPQSFHITSIEDASLKAVLATEFPEALS